MRRQSFRSTTCDHKRRGISSKANTSIAVDQQYDRIDFYTSISRAIFEELCIDPFKQMATPVERVPQDVMLDNGTIREVVLVGGSTRIPTETKLLNSLFHIKKTSKSINLDQDVTRGMLSLPVSLLRWDEKKDKDVLLDVVPLTLGIEAAGGVTIALIPRNTTVPKKKSHVFATYADSLSVS